MRLQEALKKKKNENRHVSKQQTKKKGCLQDSAATKLGALRSQAALQDSGCSYSPPLEKEKVESPGSGARMRRESNRSPRHRGPAPSHVLLQLRPAPSLIPGAASGAETLQPRSRTLRVVPRPGGPRRWRRRWDRLAGRLEARAHAEWGPRGRTPFAGAAEGQPTLKFPARRVPRQGSPGLGSEIASLRRLLRWLQRSSWSRERRGGNCIWTAVAAGSSRTGHSCPVRWDPGPHSLRSVAARWPADCGRAGLSGAPGTRRGHPRAQAAGLRRRLPSPAGREATYHGARDQVEPQTSGGLD